MPTSQDYQFRILADRYARKDTKAEAAPGDMVVISMKRRFERDGELVESREIGVVKEKSSDTKAPLYTVALVDSTKKEEEWEVVKRVDPHRMDVLIERSYEEICERIAKGIIANEPENTEFQKVIYEAMVDRAFVPAGRILTGLGCEDRTLTFFNCYVFASPHDSRKGIAEHWGKLFDTYSLGGGIGWDNSSLRPRGSIVHKVNGRSSGSVSWMEQFSQITGAVEQGGSRRGASLMGLWCWHPDIVEFIHAKSLREDFKVGDTKVSRNKNLLENANVSVLISDSFMDAVKNDEEWELVFPDMTHPSYDKTWDGDIDRWKAEDKPIKIYNVMPARELWNMITKQAWESGEPGLLFMERANRLSNSYYYAKLRCTNPCVTGDTLVTVWEEGENPKEIQIRDLVGRKGLHLAVDDRELSHNEYIDLNMITNSHIAADQAEDVIHTGKRPVYRLQIDGAHSSAAKKHGDSYTNLHLTGDHKVRTTRGMIPAQDLEAGDEVHVIGGGTAKVIHCTPRGGSQDVYDVVNTYTHTFIANGIVVSNCGEQMLPPSSVCNLGHVNLARFIRKEAEQLPAKETTSQEAVKSFDLHKFTETVQAGIRFLDNITDLNHYHDPTIEARQKSERRIGLGVLGYGELLVRLGLRYGSEEALKFTNWLFETFSEISYITSSQLAEERGPFAKFDKTKFLNSGFMKQHTTMVREAVEEHGIRNVTINTVAPTGSVGTMLGTTTGIEPYFLAEWVARSRIGTADEEASILTEMKNKFGDKRPSYFVTTQDITPEEHVKTQGVIQRWIDSSISKTVNLPNSATKEDVARTYEMLYSEGCKGGTVYRDGSRDRQVLYYKEDGKKAERTEKKSIPVEVVDEYKPNGMGILRPKITKGLGVINSKETPVGLVHGVIRMHPKTGAPYDIFLVSGKGDVSADVQAIGRLISTILRWPDGEVIPQELRLEMIRDQLHRIPGRGQVGFGPDKVISLPDGIAQILNDYLSGDFPMPNIPLGEDQLDDFLNQLTKDLDADRKSMHDWIINETTEEESPEQQFEEPDSMGFDFDICPKCGNATYVHIPNKCPYCVSCMHTEC